MKAVYASTINNDSPLAALAVGDQPEPITRQYWSTISVRAVSVNHHDIWSLKGVGLSAEQMPMILGTDAVGILDEDIPGKHGLKAGSEVVLYTFIGTDGNGVAPGERRSILSEKYPGTMAQKTSVPSANVFAKPANLTTVEASALGTSWLTAYSLLFNAAGIKPGDSVLIQGAGGGVSTAAIQLAHAAGLEVFVTSREAEKRTKAFELGANAALEIGARLPRKVDAVIESVGAATWSHSMKSVRPGGTIAICGATTGDQPGAELTRLFFQDIRVQGSTMGSREDFARLLRFVEHANIHPAIDSVFAGLDAAPQAFAKMVSGDVFGKVVIEL
ncbi:zinc-binding dehydrogenase [Bifidobacterium felsineum]|uniref:Zn-dependent oxidoreductase n=1 Tax=Bifidobacterium felsineum TaxID=2045440 RepID=A0A2M9HJA3_9BIFI|nr:zinc-binding dehydrogenase [Bifidobacterium felsineum]PJM76891.1 Zn-dependent oxidoreductase [Bifidobacterium felsineum]